MKKIILMTLVVIALVASSCKEESLGVSKVTTYPTLSLNGSEEMFWEYGTPFVDPGCKAFEGTTDISDKVTMVSDIDVDQIGRYHMTYKVLNSDGFEASIGRTVYVYNSTDTRNGFYNSKSIRSYQGGAYTTRGPWASSIMVFGNGSDELWVEDLIGGWYYIGSGYGIDYATAGVVKLNTSVVPNLVSTLKNVEPLPWGYVVALTTAEPSFYDPLTQTLQVNDEIASVPMKFRVTLNNPTPLN